MKSSQKIFFGGVPYGMDLRRLDEAFPANELAEGQLINHEQLSGILNEKCGTQRYYGVVNAWIKRMLNANGIYLAWVPSEGIRVLDPAGVLDRAEKLTRQKMKQTGRALKTYLWVDRKRLDQIGQRRLDHQLQNATKIQLFLDGQKRELAVELGPVKSLPKPKIA